MQLATVHEPKKPLMSMVVGDEGMRESMNR
jgi:hypothetical protein